MTGLTVPENVEPSQGNGTVPPQNPLPLPPQEPQEPQEEPRTILEEIADRRIAERDRQLGLSFGAAVEANPDVAAEVQRLANRSGLGPGVVERNVERVRKLVRRRELEAGVAGGILAEMFLDPEFAKVVHDDTAALTAFERVALGTELGSLAIERGRLATRKGERGLHPTDDRRLAEVNRLIQTHPNPGGFIFNAAQIGVVFAGTIPQALERGAQTALAAAGTAFVFGQLGPQAAFPEEAVTVPGAIVVAGLAGMATEFARQTYIIEGGNLYQDLLEQDIDPNRAWQISRVGGVIMAASETLGAGLVAGGAGIVTRPIRRAILQRAGQQAAQELSRGTVGRAGLDAAKAYVTGVVGETATETFQEIVAIGAEHIARRQEGKPSNLDQAAERIGHTMVATVQGMMLIGLPGPSATFIADVARVRRSESGADGIEALAKAAGKTKTKARSPEVAERFFGRTLEGKAGETTYVDAGEFAGALAQSGWTQEQFEERLPDVAEQLPGALATGGDVNMPTARYLAQVADTELDAPLHEHLRFDPNDHSAAELPAVKALQEGQAEEAVANLEDRVTFAESARAVEERFRKQTEATGRVSPKEARDSAEAYRAFVETQAARKNLTPEEFVEQFGVTVVRGEGAVGGKPARTLPLEDSSVGDSVTVFDPTGRPVAATVSKISETGARLVTLEDGTDAVLNVEEIQSQDSRSPDFTFDVGLPLIDGQAVSELSDTELETAHSRLSEIIQALKDGGQGSRALQAVTAANAIRFEQKRRAGKPLEQVAEPDWLSLRPELAEQWKAGTVTDDQVVDQLLAPFEGGNKIGEEVVEDGPTGTRRLELREIGANIDATNVSHREAFAAAREGALEELREARQEAAPDPADPNILRQKTKAAFSIDESGKGVIALFEGADVTSVLHELAHGFLHWYGQLAADAIGPAQVVADMDAFLEWRGIEGGLDAWNAMDREAQRPHHEAFAEGFETYAFTGQAPSMALQRVFSNFRRWIVELWRNVRGKNRTVDPEIRGVFDRMLASQDAIEHAESVRGLAPLFGEKPEGMSDFEWANYQQGIGDATNAAVDEVDRRGLRDMQWLSGARGKRLREMQRQHDKVRQQVRDEVQDEAEVEPIHRARRFLRRGELVSEDGVLDEFDGQHKLQTSAVRELLSVPVAPIQLGDMELSAAIASLGGVSREQALAHGVDPGEINKRTNVGGRIRFLFPKKGRTLDDIREALAQEGFAFDDVPSLADAILNSLTGVQVFSAKRQVTDASVLNELGEGAAPAATVDLRALRVTSPEGLAPDLVAEMFGFDSGAELVTALVEAPQLAEVVNERTDERMMAEHADLADAGAVQRAVDESLRNPMRAKILGTEIRALTGAQQPVRVLTAAARDVARRVLAETPVSQIKPWRYQAAEARAHRTAMRALGKADTAATIKAKWDELRQHEMARLAVQVEKEVAFAVGPSRRSTKTKVPFRLFFRSDKDLAATRDIDLIHGGRALLRSVQFKPVAEGQELEQQAAALETIREDFAVMHNSIQSLRAQFGGTSFLRLTLDQFRNVADTAAAVWSLSRASKLLVIEGRKMELAEARGMLEAAMGALPTRIAPGAVAPQGITPALGARTVQGGWHFLASAKRFQHWSLFMDGGKADGPFQDLILRPMMAHLDAYRAQRNAIYERLNTRLGKLMKQYGARWDNWINAPELDHTNDKGEAVRVRFRGVRELGDVLFDIGNTSNLEKRLVGEGWALDPRKTGEPLDTSKWDAFFARNLQTEENPGGLITPELMSLVSEVWSEFEAIKEQAQQSHKEVLGYEFKELELTDVVLPWGTITGGYAPLRVDQARALRPRRQAEAIENIQGMEHDFAYSRHSVGTGRGFTMERNPNYHDKLTMDMGRRLQAFDEELRFIHLQPHVRNVLRIVQDREFEASMNAYDREGIRSIILPWLDSTARQVVSNPGKHPLLDAAANFARAGTGVAYLGLNATVAMVQLTGLSLARTQVSRKYHWMGFQHFLRNPRGAWEDAAAKSIRMQDRLKTHARKIQDGISRQAFGKAMRSGKIIKEAGGRFAWLPIRILQGTVDVITWHGAYQQSIANSAKDADMDAVEKRAIQDADLAVERSQGGSNPENLARFEADTPVMRSFFQFMTFSNTLANQSLVRAGLTRRTGNRAVDIAKVFGNMLWLPIMISFWETVMREPLQGFEDEDDDGYLDDLAGAYIVNLGRNALGMIPLAGPSILALASGEADRLGTAPAMSALRTAAKGFASIVEGDPDARAIGTLIALTTGIPVTPITKAVAYESKVRSGKITPSGPIDRVRGLIIGR